LQLEQGEDVAERAEEEMAHLARAQA
jgi:hypothetical protein